MKIILAIAFVVSVFGIPAVASADVRCSNPCVVDQDGTQGDFAGAESGWFSGSFGPFHGKHGTPDDNGKQDMPLFDNAWGSYPGGAGQTSEDFINADIAGG